MKSFVKRPLAKTVAILLAAVLLTGFVCVGLGIFYAAGNGWYTGEKEAYSNSFFFSEASRDYGDAACSLFLYDTFRENMANTERYERMLDTANTNFRYCIYDDQTNAVVGGTLRLPYEEALRRGQQNSGLWYGEQRYSIVSMLDEDMAVEDAFSKQAAAYETFYANRVNALYLAGGLAVALLLLAFFLAGAAGQYTDAKEQDRAEIRYLNHIPFDLYLGLVIVGLMMLLYSTAQFYQSSPSLGFFFAVVALFLGSLLCIGLYMALSARLKTRTLLRTTLIGTVCRWIFRGLGWVFRGMGEVLRHLPLVLKYVLYYLIFGILNVAAITGGSGVGVLMILLLDLAGLMLLCKAALDMEKLKKAGIALSKGDFLTEVPVKGMLPAFRRHGENLNSIRLGSEKALAEQMRAERMKTDLITNVSHDIKTPLTSIVNYVDLLKKEPMSSPAAREYLQVLDRQTQRLKKLTMDIVEASKASSGALQCEMQRTNLRELMLQCAGEYGERFESAGLTLLTDAPEQALPVLADGRLLWRVMDNLLGNALKYAQPGTRVYFTGERREHTACLSIKNISREPLNISPEELTERFVRGDLSRGSEGSGLGLSIAKDLTTLQGGLLALSIDGDLFKAELSFPMDNTSPAPSESLTCPYKLEPSACEPNPEKGECVAGEPDQPQIPKMEALSGSMEEQGGGTAPEETENVQSYIPWANVICPWNTEAGRPLPDGP